MATTGRRYIAEFIADPTTGAPMGALGIDGREWLFPALTQNAASATAQAPAYNPAAVAITGGSIESTTIGLTTRQSAGFLQLAVTSSDLSGTPGSVTANVATGRAAFAAAGTTVTVTNSRVFSATSQVFVQLQGSDATLTSVRVTNVAAGSFTVTGNAAATAATTFSFLVINT
jgi:hypothetical protein